MEPGTITLISQWVSGAVFFIVVGCRGILGRYTLKRNPNSLFFSLFFPLFFDRQLKRKWSVILFLVIIGSMIGLESVGIPFWVGALLCLVLAPIMVSLLGRILKANIWKDDKPPSIDSVGEN